MQLCLDNFVLYCNQYVLTLGHTEDDRKEPAILLVGLVPMCCSWC